MEQKEERVILSRILLCRHTRKRKEYLAMFGRSESKSQPPDTYFFQFFEDDMKKESRSFNFRKNDFCGVELTRVIKKSFFGSESNVMRLHVLFTKQINIELEVTKNTLSQYRDKIIHEWCRTLEMELGYHCHWTVYIRPHGELEWIEGYGNLHFTDDIFSIVSTDKHPITIHHWELTDVLSVKVGPGCLVMTYKNIKGALMFETNQAEDIQQKLVSKIPNLSLKPEQDVPRTPGKSPQGKWKNQSVRLRVLSPRPSDSDSSSDEIEPNPHRSWDPPSEGPARDAPLSPKPDQENNLTSNFDLNNPVAGSSASTPSPFCEESDSYENHPLPPPGPPPLKRIILSEIHSDSSSVSGSSMKLPQTSPSDPNDPSANQWSEDSSASAEQLHDEHEFDISEISSGMNDYQISAIEYVNHENTSSQTAPDLPPKDIIEQYEPSPSSDSDYISAVNICHTLNNMLSMDPPVPDTLGLRWSIRRQVCIHLYLNVGGSNWKGLADSIGLEYRAVELIDVFSLRHPNETSAEIVLRHWQFCYNRYGNDKEKCPQICNKDTLIRILKNMHRHDIIQIIDTAVS